MPENTVRCSAPMSSVSRKSLSAPRRSSLRRRARRAARSSGTRSISISAVAAARCRSSQRAAGSLPVQPAVAAIDRLAPTGRELDARQERLERSRIGSRASSECGSAHRPTELAGGEQTPPRARRRGHDGLQVDHQRAEQVDPHRADGRRPRPPSSDSFASSHGLRSSMYWFARSASAMILRTAREYSRASKSAARCVGGGRELGEQRVARATRPRAAAASRVR